MTLNEQITECERLEAEAESDIMRRYWKKTGDELRAKFSEAFVNARVAAFHE